MIKQIFVLLLFCTLGLHATVTLTDDKEIYDDFTLQYLYDEDASLTIDEIEQADFTATISNQFTQGYHKGAAWFKIEINNQSKNEDFVLYFAEPFWTKLDLYSKNNGTWSIQKNGLNAMKAHPFF